MTSLGYSAKINAFIPSVVGVNPYSFNYRLLNLISGESKLLTKKILESKYWHDEDELVMIENVEN